MKTPQAAKFKPIFIDRTGPMVRYDGSMLYINDLNPSVATQWRMSRREMIVFAAKALWAAVTP